MNAVPLVTLLSATVLVLGLAYLREARLRRALQRLLARLLSRWRTNRDTEAPQPDAAASDTADDRDGGL